MKSLLEIFPRASKSTLDINPKLIDKRREPVTGSAEAMSKASVSPPSRSHRMNKTEREFSLILEVMKQKGEILRYEYEGITLNFSGVRYTPDFLIFTGKDPNPYGLNLRREHLAIKLIEVKGPWIKGKYERAIERFRHARSVFPEFAFELHQKQKGGQWKRIM